MRRIETYVGQQVYEWAFSAQAQYTMTGIAKVCAALFGVNGTVNGLACAPTGPATMAVQIGAGEIYQIEPLEATACGTLPQNTANTILKQGIQLGTVTTATFATPTTSGQSINYLIEAQYQDSDISLDPTTGNTPVVLQFYNSTNPTSPWSGPGNTGSTSNTFRDGVVAYQIKAGTAATTGSQVTPTPDTGWIGIWVVTVPFGATSLTSSNIAQYTGSPILPNGILQSILTSNLTYGIDIGTAGVVQAKFPIPVATLVDGMDVWVKIAATNTGASTFTPNPGVISASPVIGAAHAALQGNELIAGGRANFVWRADVTSWVLVECTGASIQVAPATSSQHAMQLGQATGRLLQTTVFAITGGAQKVSVNGGAFSTTGASTFTSLASTNKVRVRQTGGGGGGGSAAATASNSVSCGAGGGSAAYAESIFTSGFSGGIAATVGAGGAAGNMGGTTTFGALVSTTGGGGGTTGAATSTFPVVGLGGAGGTTSNGNVVSSTGQQGGLGIAANTGDFISGAGAPSVFGGGANGIGSATNGGAAGSAPGSGGAGAACAISTGTTQTGGAGAPGIIIVEEFA